MGEDRVLCHTQSHMSSACALGGRGAWEGDHTPSERGKSGLRREREPVRKTAGHMRAEFMASDGSL